jgi:predicted acyl esterase
MRDGARLFTVVYVPKDASPRRRYPIVLTRTPFPVAPYDETAYPPVLGPDRYMLRDGYIFASQEVRGRYLSEGEFENVRP